MQIEYIAQWEDSSFEKTPRSFSPAGVAKMRYYLDVLSEIGADVEIYSTSARQNKGFSFSKTISANNRRIKYRASFRSANPYINYFDIIFGQVQLALKLLFLNRKRIIVFYHERLYTPILKYIARLRRLKYILDVEEIYSLAADREEKYLMRELSSISGASAYILATSSLTNYVDEDAPVVICNGNYSSPLHIHSGDYKRILYSGTFERRKGGVQIAIASAEYLPPDYTLVICGFGSESEVAEVERAIESHNKSGKGCKIEYHGKLMGKSYFDILKSCGIGLACQNPSHKLCTTSFPSKIFEYLRGGMKVISSDIQVVKDSVCAPVITFFTPFTANILANTIVNGCKNDNHTNIREIMSNAHIQVKDALIKILNNDLIV